MQIGETVEINLDDFLGIGGQALVIRRKRGNVVNALKIIPLDEETDGYYEDLNGIPCETKRPKYEMLASRMYGHVHDLNSIQTEIRFCHPWFLEGRSEYECSSIIHPNVIRYENVTMDVVNNEVCLLVLMGAYSCNLWQYLKNFHNQNRHIPMAVRFKLFEKILAGSAEIQNRGFRHLDLKPANVLLKTRPDGTWNEDDCVLTDFGVGGPDILTELAGTPGFSSPEQLIGPSHPKSDNYSFAKLMVMVFCYWPTAWDLLFRPVTENERNQIQFNPGFMHVVRELLKVKNEINFIIKKIF